MEKNRRELEALIEARRIMGRLKVLTPNKGVYTLSLGKHLVEVAFKLINGRYYFEAETPEPGVIVLRQPSNLVEFAKRLPENATSQEEDAAFANALDALTREGSDDDAGNAEVLE